MSVEHAKAWFLEALEVYESTRGYLRGPISMVEIMQAIGVPQLIGTGAPFDYALILKGKGYSESRPGMWMKCRGSEAAPNVK